ncbi:MAG: sodium:alanine symporter family protein, partial [Gemmatimonadota bacterium]|nr:sodium:alanine symporter family protein [Gemmatimonadota bacterium]
METLGTVISAVKGYVWDWGIPVGDSDIPLVVIALIGTGVFLTLRLGLIQLRHFGHGVAVATGRYD